ncbi:hypothetical protein, partial [Aeromonas rivipollensis]|uniref:hypothetical protein n=1 Tax=Aeromonas rivipollensis TaxID=948519 RepID=UPI0029729E2E|nr:hypothetical protein [Aeromonas rivipollensis]
YKEGVTGSSPVTTTMTCKQEGPHSSAGLLVLAAAGSLSGDRDLLMGLCAASGYNFGLSKR